MPSGRSRIRTKIENKRLSFRINISLSSIGLVYSWMTYKGMNMNVDCLSQTKFYSTLAEELIDNDIDSAIQTRPRNDRDNDDADVLGCTGIYLVQTTRKRKRIDESVTNHFFKVIVVYAKVTISLNSIALNATVEVGLRYGYVTRASVDIVSQHILTNDMVKL